MRKGHGLWGKSISTAIYLIRNRFHSDFFFVRVGLFSLTFGKEKSMGEIRF